jgi:peroxiredoxin
MNVLAGKPFAAFLLLASSAFTLASGPASIDGNWEGFATVRGQQVPIRLQISGPPSALKAALLNGPEQAFASSATLKDGKLVVAFNYYARTLEATVSGSEDKQDTLTGTFGLTSTSPKAAPRVPVTLHHVSSAASTPTAGPDIHGDWEIAVASNKGESAWQLGDTGPLYGSWDGHQYTVSHFTPAGPALYSLTPQPDGTLLVSNLIASEALKAQSRDLLARRPADARKQNLAAPTESTQQTRMKDPSAPFAFSFPDLSGKLVSSTDPQFRNKVVIVAIGGSWCPNCHDEAPFLESLYKQFHAKGLEIVDLSFEEDDQLKTLTRLHAFIQRYGLTYTVLVAGTPDDLNEKITQADHLNSWPTSFFIGRDGRVREIHAGFAGPANPQAHEELQNEVTTLVEKLIAEPASVQKAAN